MLRIICQQINSAHAQAVGGPCVVKPKTFDIEAPEVEAWLKDENMALEKEVLGAFVLEDTNDNS